MVFTVTTIRDYATRAGRVVTVAQNRPSLLGRLAAFVLIVAVLVLILAIAVPLLIFFAAVGLLFWGWLRLRLWLAGASQPNGVLDGRRNVRVVTGPRPGEERAP